MKYRNTIFTKLLIALLLLSAPAPEIKAQGNPEPSPARIENYVIDDALEATLKRVVKDSGLSIKFTSDVEGRVIKKKLEGQYGVILDQLSGEHQFDWFKLNDLIYISKKSDGVTRVLKSPNITHQQLTSLMKQAGLPTLRFPIKSIANGKVFLLSGPPTFVSLVETLFEVSPTQEIPKIATKATPVDNGKDDCEETQSCQQEIHILRYGKRFTIYR